MPKGNKKGGKKHKRGKKDLFENRKLILKNVKDGQEYAQIKRVNGSGRYDLYCFDGTDRLGICAGNIKRRTRIQIYDIVLISKWEFQDNKCSIIHKYDEDEVQELKIKNEFPKNIKLEGDGSIFNEDSGSAVEFSYDMPDDDAKLGVGVEESSSSDEDDFSVDVNDI